MNFVKSLRSILTLLDNGISYDANYLVRSLYENYLRIKYVYLDSSRASQILGFDAAGSPKSEREPIKLRRPPPFKNIAQSIGELGVFESLYGELSQITHSQSVTIKHLLDGEGGFDFLSLNSDFELSTLLTAHEISIRILDCMYEHCSCPNPFKADLMTAMKRSFGAFLMGWLYVSEMDNCEMSRWSAALVDELSRRHSPLRKIKAAAR